MKLLCVILQWFYSFFFFERILLSKSNIVDADVSHEMLPRYTEYYACSSNYRPFDSHCSLTSSEWMAIMCGLLDKLRPHCKCDNYSMLVTWRSFLFYRHSSDIPEIRKWNEWYFRSAWNKNTNAYYWAIDIVAYCIKIIKFKHMVFRYFFNVPINPRFIINATCIMTWSTWPSG